MLLTLRKHGKTFHADLLDGRRHAVRGSLGTRDQSAALRLKHRLEIALSEGSNSNLWPELSTTLPRSTYQRFASFVGVKERQLPTWDGLWQAFKIHMAQRVAIGKLQQITLDRYNRTLREFDLFLKERNLSLLEDISNSVIEEFKVWRFERIKKRKESRGATGLVLDVAILHNAFQRGLKKRLIIENPVQMEGRPGENPQRGAQPFTAAELSRLRDHAGDDLLTFLLLRWTGFRGSDAVGLVWSEVHFDRREIDRVTQKRKKQVILPLQTELLFAVEAELGRRKPQPTERVLLNPKTGKPLTRPRLYQRMLALGTRAGVPNAHPHRFRDTLAVDLLLRGASPYDVAKMLGDTIETVEKHYMPFVTELRERVRRFLDSEGGLEQVPSTRVTPASQSGKRIQ